MQLLSMGIENTHARNTKPVCTKSVDSECTYTLQIQNKIKLMVYFNLKITELTQYTIYVL